MDVAKDMITTLRHCLTELEEELLRKEEVVVTFNHFLEAATTKEVQGKAWLQDFENLLQWVELMEKQSTTKASRPQAKAVTSVSMCLTDISSNRKPKCLSQGYSHSVCSHSNLKTHFYQGWQSQHAACQVRSQTG